MRKGDRITFTVFYKGKAEPKKVEHEYKNKEEYDYELQSLMTFCQGRAPPIIVVEHRNGKLYKTHMTQHYKKGEKK